VKGHRRKKSRGFLDSRKVCNCGACDNLIMCDKCLDPYCHVCDGRYDGEANHWICTTCTVFDEENKIAEMDN
jgi:hypothetical protein